MKLNIAYPKQWEFLRQISSDSNNTVIGLVRNKSATEEKLKGELPDRTNIHIVEADITDYAALKVRISDIHEDVLLMYCYSTRRERLQRSLVGGSII